MGTPQRRSGPLVAPQLARAVMTAVFVAFYALVLLRINLIGLGAGYVVLSTVYATALLALQLFYFSRPRVARPGPRTYAALLVQAALVFGPILQYGEAWIGLPGFLAGSVLLALPSRLAWPGAAAVVAATAAAQAAFTPDWVSVFYTLVSTAITGLVTYGLTRLSSLVLALHEARTELARLAVADERLRFARDLHDLLGYSLSAITLKSELTLRLIPLAPERARGELAEILEISRGALADVRTVASGYRELSLETEAESARSVLTAAEVEVRMALDYGTIPVRVRTVLATVLREGVTNVLRHSKAEHVDVTVRKEGSSVRLDVVNDGVPVRLAGSGRTGGSGIRNLEVRAGELGGGLVAGVDPDGRFRLTATVPTGDPARPAGA